MQGKLLTLICAVAITRGVLSNVDPLSACSRACNVCTCLPTEPPTVCSSKEAEGTLLPHEHCNKFYICNHGSKVTFDCFGDLLFNPLTGQCDYEYNVVCGDRVIPEKEDTNDESEGSESNSNDTDNESVAEEVEDNNEGNGNCNCNPSEASSICLATESDGILVAHEMCNKFFLCAHGVPTTISCPKGLLYNPYTEECDWPNNVECGDRIIIEEVEADNGTSDKEEAEVENGNVDSDNNVAGGNCNCNPDEAPLICSNPGFEGTLVAHEVCNKYFVCNNGIPVTMNCPKELLYNPYIKQCDWSHNVECGDRIIVVETEDNNDNSDIDKDNNNGDNQNNGGNNTCNCNPSEAPLICAVNGSDGKLVAHEICNRYFICDHGVPTTVKCPNGLLYNPYTERCDWPYNVECGDRVIIEEEDNNNNSENGNHSNESNESTGDNDNNVGACNCDPAEAPSLCSKEGSDGTLVAHEVCCKFYICSHGVPVTQSCPLGLLYNPRTEKCDWPQNVECGDRVIIEKEEDNNDNSENGNHSNESNESSGDNDNNVGACNCDPAEAPSICSKEGSDGYLVAHEVCCKFYICSHGVPFTQSCPLGLLYNPHTEKCDWPQNVECGDRVIIEEEEDNNDNSENGNHSNESNESNGDNDNNVGVCNCDPAEAPSVCSKEGSDGTLVAHEVCCKFYICSHGVPVTQNCPLGLLYNPNTEKCDWPQNVECGDRVIIEEDKDSSENGNHSNESNENSGDNDNNVGSCNCDPAEAPSVCSKEGSDGTLVAHEVCCKFYICSHGVPVTQSCPLGLLYNPHTEKCDWPQNVECGDRVIIEEEEDNNDNSENGNHSNESNESSGDNDNNVGACNCDPAEAPSVCSKEGSDGYLVAHEVCCKFYICSHGVPVTQSCPLGLLYNPHTEKCDWPQNVECGDRVIIEEEEDNNDNSENGNHSNESNESSGDNDNNVGACNCDPAEAPSVCSKEGSDGTLVAHEVCCKFYICSHGVPVTQSCPLGLLYNPHTEKCDWPQNVECGDRVIIEEDNDSSENGNHSNESNENSGDNDNNVGSCNCDPAEAPSVCSKEGSEGTLVAHEVCCKFYICSHGVPVTQSCPLGLLYNPHTEKCDWPQNVECGDRVIIEEDNDSSENGNHSNESNENSGDNDNNVGSCNCDPAEAPSVCSKEGSDGTLVAHEVCCKFYICSHGVPVTQSCPLGLLYNPHTEKCDWPQNVECGDRVIIEEDNDNSENGNHSNESNENSGDNDNNVGSCNCDPAEAPSVCLKEGSDGTLVAHDVCCKFYVCSNGVPVTQSCPLGLLYNPHTEKCDWPHNVECGDRLVVEENGGEESENGNISNEIDEEENDAGNYNPAEAPSICAAEGSDGTLIAHEVCSKFFICAHGVPVIQNCPLRLLYDPHTKKCNYPENVQCGDRIIVEVEEELDESENENAGNSTCNCNPAEAASICSVENSDGTLIAHEVCCWFYKCDHGIATVQACPSGLFYNPYTEVCDWPHNVNCGDRVQSEEELNGDHGEGNTSHETNGNNVPEVSQSEMDLFEIAKNECSENESDGRMAVHQNCHQFYVCFKHEPALLSCPLGLYFNAETQICDWPQNVQCGSRLMIKN